MRPDPASKHYLAERLANVLRRFEHEGGAIGTLARAVGETPRDLRRWADGVTLPGHVALAIESLSNGRIDAADLNDDVRAARHGVSVTAADNSTSPGKIAETSLGVAGA